ncbi:hypothetical protein ASG49_00050 [Marmoricola sp. Leaf446]|uniref:hypothetical protein n=1 Tax=Marmoricola sp. Leaf446 TaxID=1736379 RepID=UPI0006F311B1|nr:hypothetical protein [Marmoricola sp. Leaf446]KQT93464.1 hypothetical protein ASG49_00050 [Marmoricola sp. Leaf446]
MPWPGYVFLSLLALLVVAAVLLVVHAVKKQGAGQEELSQRGWTALPDEAGPDVVAGWRGWPFDRGTKPGDARDIATGQYQGVHFLHLRWNQHEGSTNGGASSDNESYTILALRVEQQYPHLSVVRGNYKVDRSRLTEETAEFETGDARFDRRWQTLGDAEFGRAVLSPEVRAALDADNHALVFQPGSITKVRPWRYYAGEDQMTEDLDQLAAVVRLVPTEVWKRYGGAPRFLQSLGHGQVGG